MQYSKIKASCIAKKIIGVITYLACAEQLYGIVKFNIAKDKLHKLVTNIENLICKFSFFVLDSNIIPQTEISSKTMLVMYSITTIKLFKNQNGLTLVLNTFEKTLWSVIKNED